MAGDKVRILGLGNPLMELQAKVDVNFLNKHGLAEDGAIRIDSVRGTKLLNELYESYNIAHQVGGCVANFLKMVHWISESISSTFVGAVGKDDGAEIIREDLSKSGVEYRFQEVATQPTGYCIALISNAKRSLCTNPGASNCFDSEFLQEPMVEETILKSNVYFIAVSSNCLVAFSKVKLYQ